MDLIKKLKKLIKVSNNLKLMAFLLAIVLVLFGPIPSQAEEQPDILVKITDFLNAAYFSNPNQRWNPMVLRPLETEDQLTLKDFSFKKLNPQKRVHKTFLVSLDRENGKIEIYDLDKNHLSTRTHWKLFLVTLLNRSSKNYLEYWLSQPINPDPQISFGNWSEDLHFEAIQKTFILLELRTQSLPNENTTEPMGTRRIVPVAGFRG